MKHSSPPNLASPLQHKGGWERGVEMEKVLSCGAGTFALAPPGVTCVSPALDPPNGRSHARIRQAFFGSAVDTNANTETAYMLFYQSQEWDFSGSSQGPFPDEIVSQPPGPSSPAQASSSARGPSRSRSVPAGDV